MKRPAPTNYNGGEYYKTEDLDPNEDASTVGPHHFDSNNVITKSNSACAWTALELNFYRINLFEGLTEAQFFSQKELDNCQLTPNQQAFLDSYEEFQPILHKEYPTADVTKYQSYLEKDILSYWICMREIISKPGYEAYVDELISTLFKLSALGDNISSVVRRLEPLTLQTVDVTHHIYPDFCVKSIGIDSCLCLVQEDKSKENKVDDPVAQVPKGRN